MVFVLLLWRVLMDMEWEIFMIIGLEVEEINTNKCFVVNVKQPVKIRKFDVDTDKLKQLLRQQKQQIGLSCKKISEILNKPKTLVEHWFRNDNCFAIPDEDVWFQLKELLQIDTDEFDKSIMTFEYRDGVYEKSERCYMDYGICPTLTCSDEIKIIDTRLFLP